MALGRIIKDFKEDIVICPLKRNMPYGFLSFIKTVHGKMSLELIRNLYLKSLLEI